MSKYRIGCSGYYYPYWKNKFYPKGLAPKNWLHYYSTIFNTVELNGTFYRIPKLSDLQRYAATTPDGFKFSVKMPKAITHYNKLKETKQQALDFQLLVEEGLKHKLDFFLFQLPPSFQFNEENLERLLQNIPNRPQNVVELRHLSWWNEQTKDALKKAKLTFCNVDYPGLETYFIHTTKVFYLRLHGNPELFKSAYKKTELETFYKNFPLNCASYSVYFNNTYYESGYANARELIDLIADA